MTYFSVLCGKNVVNNHFADFCKLLEMLIYQPFEAFQDWVLPLVSGPKGRGFESRHFDQRIPAEYKAPQGFLFLLICRFYRF